MRLHRLRVTAFGPFAETVEVDFDRLSDAGIFLLSGPTGAGKTALLDAVAFALYAEVPGDRNVAKRLRCDSAPELLAPEVTLEVTLRNRQLRITRSPAWQRPKRRGTGQTTQQAKVVLQERLAGGGWVTRSTRIDEAALLLGDLLGLTHAQFCQVVMLPQGRFQAFLRAGGEDRQRLLQRLFHTGRFEAVEKWLAEQRRSTRRAAQEAHSTMLSTAHALARECPAADPMPLAEAEVLVWAEGVADRLKVEAAQSQSRLERWRIVNDGRERAHRGALELDQRQARHRQALEALDALLAASTLQEARAEQLRRAERADPLIVLVDQQRVAAAEVADARTQVRASAARDHTAQSLPDASATHQLVDVVQGLDELERALATFRALSPLADQVEALSSELAAAAGDAARSHDAWLQAQTRVSVCAGHQEALTGELMAAQTATERLREVSEEHSELVAWHADFTTLGRLRHQHGEVQQELLRCREISVSCKETWLNLQQVRISGMAAELAGALAAGCRCPVCGSAEHPHPARPSSFAPDAVDERAARKSYEDAESLAQAARDQQVGLSTRISALADQLGTRDEAEVRARLHELVQAEAGARPLADSLATVRSRHEAAHTHLAKAREAADSAERAHLAAAAALKARGAALAPLQADLRAACGEADPRLEVARLEESCGALRRRHALIERWAAAEQAASKAAQVLLEAATRAGFVDTHDALSSLLPREERRQLEEQLADHDARLRAAETVLADPEIRAAAAQAAPDVASLATRAASALASAERSAAIATLTADRHRRAESLIADLRRLHHRWAAADETADLAASLSTLVEGTSPDNHARLRLSAYVLSHRLGQVIAAANERLETMSDHRYRLEHTTTARGGLGLSILDDWSGESRDPMTLSGGETFVVSLALALGLADVISVESGATVLDTLFVDEGFGALDSDTLSDVLDTIDGLREGGRVVGLVSHVPEMRERIPTRVEVHKERTGSTVRLVPTSTPTAQC